MCVCACVSSALCELVCVYFEVGHIFPPSSLISVFFQKATLPNTLLGLGKGECAMRKSRRGRRSGGEKGGGGERKRGRVCQGFTEEGGKSEEPRFKFDLFVLSPSMSHLHVPVEPRVGRRAGIAFMFMFMRVCGGHTRARWKKK